MAMVALFRAQSVTQTGYPHWEACGVGDVGAVEFTEEMKGKASSMYGLPMWLVDATHVRMVDAPAEESLSLVAYRPDPSTGADDPNAVFFSASPSGEFKMIVQNPGAMGYVKAGKLYRITIEEIRGPRG